MKKHRIPDYNRYKQEWDGFNRTSRDIRWQNNYLEMQGYAEKLEAEVQGLKEALADMTMERNRYADQCKRLRLCLIDLQA